MNPCQIFMFPRHPHHPRQNFMDPCHAQHLCQNFRNPCFHTTHSKIWSMTPTNHLAHTTYAIHTTHPIHAPTLPTLPTPPTLFSISFCKWFTKWTVPKYILHKFENSEWDSRIACLASLLLCQSKLNVFSRVKEH